MRIFFILGVIVCLTFSSCYNQGKHIAEPLKVPEDKSNKNYPSSISPGKDYAYKNGFFVWNKSKKQYEYISGEWIKLKPGYYWDPGEWQKSKYGYKYRRARWRKIPKEKAKPA